MNIPMNSSFFIGAYFIEWSSKDNIPRLELANYEKFE